MNREQERFWKLLKPEYSEAAAFCRKLAGDRDIGDDLFQDSLVLALKKFGSLREESSFRPWLYRIMSRTFISTVRRPWWKRRVRLSADAEQFVGRDDPTDRLQARRWLERAFGAVSPEEQTLITLYELQDWTVGELAELYDRSEGSIKLRLFRARKKMKKALLAYAGRTSDGRQTKLIGEGAA
jgi:RNA polymerase sigma-70 factor (ECF subfamily)